ncbi:hypothetical protein Tco_0531325 [Tanacetum coccineum]
MDEVCSLCCFRDGDSFTYDPNPNSFNDSPNFSDYPPQPQYEPYSCELCRNDSHHGYDCPPQFPLGGDIDEIDAFLDIVVSTNIVNDYYDSEGDIIYLESLLIKDTTPNLPPDVFLDHDPRSLKDKLDKDDLKSMVKVFDPIIHKKKFSPTYVSLSFEDHHYLSFTYVIRIFLPYFTYAMESSSLPLSSGSEDIIFDPDISAFHFSSLEPVAYECPIEVCSSTCFVPNITMIWGESS